MWYSTVWSMSSTHVLPDSPLTPIKHLMAEASPPPHSIRTLQCLFVGLRNTHRPSNKYTKHFMVEVSPPEYVLAYWCQVYMQCPHPPQRTPMWVVDWPYVSCSKLPCQTTYQALAGKLQLTWICTAYCVVECVREHMRFLFELWWPADE
jgi:hypothetical protein